LPNPGDGEQIENLLPGHRVEALAPDIVGYLRHIHSEAGTMGKPKINLAAMTPGSMISR
jgi:hypothetical protein